MNDKHSAHDVWASGEAYESYIGRWSRAVAREFLAWLDVPAGRAWLDVGCGTGALSRSILQDADPKAITGVDRSAGFVEFACGSVTDPRLRFEVGDAQSLPVENSTYDAAVSALVLNFVPEPAKMVREMRRVVKPGGVAAVYVWDYAGRMQLLRFFWDAAAAFDPAAGELDEGRRFPTCHPDALNGLFQEAGLKAVETQPIDVPTIFGDFDDYWSPFLAGQGPAPGYVMSLSEDGRAALMEGIRAALPTASDGSISLVARAWGVKGIK